MAYSDCLSRYLSATCCSSGFAIALALTTCLDCVSGEDSSAAKSPAIRTRPPSSRSLRDSLPLLPLLLWASFSTSEIAFLSKWGIDLPVPLDISFLTSCAMKRISLRLFRSVSFMSVLTYTSYPYPLILLLSAGCMFWMLSRFPAATKMKSVGTGSDFVRAPDDLSERPLMESSLSCMATRRACCSSILSILISSM